LNITSSLPEPKYSTSKKKQQTISKTAIDNTETGGLGSSRKSL